VPKSATTMPVSRDPLAPLSSTEQMLAEQRVTTACAICGASTEGPVSDAVAWFAQHRKTEHPNLPEPQRPSRRQRTV
jgi:hypothetical protein